MEITIDRLLEIVRKNIIFILIVGVLFGALAYIITDFFVTPTYKAQIRMYVDTPVDATLSIDNMRKITQTYITFLDTDAFCNQLLDDIDPVTAGKYSSSKLKSMIKYSIVNNTEVFDIIITGKDPDDLIELASAAASQAPKRINLFDTDSNVNVVEGPINEKIARPVSPNARNNTIIGILLGLVFAFGLVMLRDMLDVRIKSVEDITSRFNYPIIGRVPVFHGEGKK